MTDVRVCVIAVTVLVSLFAADQWFAADLAIAQSSSTAPPAQRQIIRRAPAAQSIPRHKLVIQVDDSDPKIINLALNNAENVIEYYAAKNETVAVEVVTYGPGLHLLRADTSPVRQRIAEMSLALPNISFAACEVTRSKMAKQEGKEIPLISEARVVPSGVVRIMELQKFGYAYIRP